MWLADVLKYAVAIGGALGLFGGGRIGDARRLAGRLLAGHEPPDPERGRPTQGSGAPRIVVIGAATVAAAALVLPTDLELLVGIYAFGAMLAFTIAHVSVIALRFREPDRDRAYRVPLSVPVRGGPVPVPAVIGAVPRRSGLIALLVFHSGARYVGLAWMAGGLILYIMYRKLAAEAAAQTRHDPRARAPPRGARARVRLDPGPDPRHRARRRHHPDRRPARGRDPRRPRSRGRRDRGDLGVRDAAVAPARRAAARGADQARARGAGQGQARGGGVRGGRGGHGDRARPARRARRSCARRAGAASRRSCSRPRSPRACAAGRCLGGRRAARELRRRGLQAT